MPAWHLSQCNGRSDLGRRAAAGQAFRDRQEFLLQVEEVDSFTSILPHSEDQLQSKFIFNPKDNRCGYSEDLNDGPLSNRTIQIAGF